MLTKAEKREINDRCDFIMTQEVLNECAAGIWADYIRYCEEHGIDPDSDHPIAEKTRSVYRTKEKIIGNPECRTVESLEPIRRELKEQRKYIEWLMKKE